MAPPPLARPSLFVVRCQPELAGLGTVRPLFFEEEEEGERERKEKEEGKGEKKRREVGGGFYCKEEVKF